MPIPDFRLQHGEEPWHVMLDDRGPQITLEFPNAYALSDAACEQIHRRLGSSFKGQDLRIPVLQRALQDWNSQVLTFEAASEPAVYLLACCV